MPQKLNLTDSLLAKGRNFQQLQRHREAARVYHQLSRQAGLSAEITEMIQANLGEIYLNLRKYRRARRHLTIALLYRPDCAHYHYWLGRALKLGIDRDPARAERHFRKSLDLDPDQPDCIADLGILCMRRKKPEEGLALFRRAAAFAPDNTDLLCKVVRCLEKTGNELEARKLLMPALFRHGRSSMIRNLWDAFRFRQAQKRQQQERRQGLDNTDATILPFQGESVCEEPEMVRQDEPSHLPPPHRAGRTAPKQRWLNN